MEETISDGRKARLRPSMSAAKRLQHIAAGYLLELYLRRNGYPAVFSYEKLPSGKPYLVFADGTWAPHFSLSHSGTKVICAISPRPVGVDIEDKVYEDASVAAKERMERIGQRFFTESEKTYLAAHPEEFFGIWTYKEAMAKAYDEPLTEVFGTYDFENVREKIQDVDLSQGEAVEDHIFLVKTSIQVERECISTIKGENSFTDEAKNDGFYRLANAQFVGFLVDKESKES